MPVELINENKISLSIDTHVNANTFTGNPKVTNEGIIEELGNNHYTEQQTRHLHDYRIGTE